MITQSKYSSIHRWLSETYGKASRCESRSCAKSSTKYVWALKKDYQYDYLRNNFKQLCLSCHFRYDFDHKNTGKYKKNTGQVRISLKHYELIRRVAFRAHKPMTAILEELISQRAI